MTLSMTPIKKKIITMALTISALMQSLDTTIANVALPHIQGSLSANQDQITWILTSYIAFAAITTPAIGWISNKFGSRMIFLVAIVGFTISSMLCGMAMSLPEIVIFRAVQGIFGAVLIPLSQAIIIDINEPKDQKSAVGLWAMSIMLGPVLGPFLGGYLTDNFSWRWVFYINVPFGIVAFAGIFFAFESKKKEPLPFDILGFSLLAICLLSFQVFLDQGDQLDWLDSGQIQIYLLVALASVWMFFFHITSAKNPFISLKIFADHNFAIGTIIVFLIGVLMMASMSLTPSFLQTLLGYPVTTAGLVMGPRGVGTILSIIIATKMMNRSFDPRYIMVFGFILNAFSLYQMSLFDLNVTEQMIITTGILQGVGTGFAFIPLNVIALVKMQSERRIEGASILTLARNIGGSIGISVISCILSRSAQKNHQIISAHINIFNFDSISSLISATGADQSKIPSILDAQVNLQAQLIAYLNSFYLMMFMCIIIIPFVMMLSVPKDAKLAAEHASEI